MRTIRAYVDTSVFGGIKDEEFADASKRFFRRATAGEFTVLVSQITFDELDSAPREVQRVLRDLPGGSVEEVPFDAEARELAGAYIDAGALEPDSIEDASHVAIATVARADLILSWNFRHIVNYERIRKFNSVNIAQGYHQIEIRSPLEVGNDDQDEGI